VLHLDRQTDRDIMALGVVLKIVLVGLGLYLLRSRLLQLKNGKQAPLPPGPKPSFLVGNLSDLPRDGELEFIHWLKHKDLYGSYKNALSIPAHTKMMPYI